MFSAEKKKILMISYSILICNCEKTCNKLRLLTFLSQMLHDLLLLLLFFFFLMFFKNLQNYVPQISY